MQHKILFQYPVPIQATTTKSNMLDFYSVSSPINWQTHAVGQPKPKVFNYFKHIFGWANDS